MSKIAIIGDKETVFPFNYLGFTTIYVKGEEAKGEFKKLLGNNEIKIIFVTENITKYIEKELKESFQRAFPIITIIPSITVEKEGEKREDLVKLIEKVIGPNLLKEE